MNIKKNVSLAFFTLISLAIAMLASCGGNDMRPEKALNNFSKLIEKEDVDDLSLTIYYMSPFTLTLQPMSVDNLINANDVHKVVLSGSDLKEHIDLLNQINSDILIPIGQESRVDARVYYIFETKKNRKVFDVAMWGKDNSMFVNGVEVEENDIFYDAVMPFLSEDGCKVLESYLGRSE